MRITVNLGFFFHDHRSLAKISLNKHKYIRDVEHHISEVFNINNFYLKCENHYLPPSENIQILNNDDFVWVVPLGEKNENQTSSNGYVSPLQMDFEDIEKKIKKKKRHAEHNEIVVPYKKKKKKSHEKNIQIESEVVEVEEPPIIVKKKKKKKKHESKESSDAGNNKDRCTETSTVCKNEDISPPKVVTINGVSPKDSGRDSFDDTSRDAKITNVKTLVNTFENKQIDFGKQLLMNLSNEDRKINIVKTIIISNKKDSSISSAEKNFDSLRQEDGSTPINNSLIRNENKNPYGLNTPFKRNDASVHNSGSTNTATNPILTESTLSDSDVIRMSTNLSNDETLSIVSHSAFSELDANVNKRRRRRSHRRKRPSNKVELKPSTTSIALNVLPYKTPAQTATHVRFCDTLQDVDRQIIADESHMPVVESNFPIKESTEKKVDVLEIIDVSQNKNDIKKEISLAEDSNICSNPLDYTLKNIYLEEYIAKQPITKNLEPKIGEVIAFKILKLSENYTPEVSTDIVGKVLSFTPETKELLFDVLYGWDQCSDPQGKFSVEQDTTTEKTKREFHCVWPNILEPRIIFP